MRHYCKPITIMVHSTVPLDNLPDIQDFDFHKTTSTTAQFRPHNSQKGKLICLKTKKTTKKTIINIDYVMTHEGTYTLGNESKVVCQKGGILYWSDGKQIGIVSKEEIAEFNKSYEFKKTDKKLSGVFVG